MSVNDNKEKQGLDKYKSKGESEGEEEDVGYVLLPFVAFFFSLKGVKAYNRYR